MRRISLLIVPAYFAQEWFHQNALRIRLEGYSETELDRVIQMGDSTDFPLHAPAVMDLNMRAASSAMLLFVTCLSNFYTARFPIASGNP